MSHDLGVPLRDTLNTSVDLPHSGTHAVHFYEDENLFLDSLAEYVGSALGSGGACVIAATSAHLQRIDGALRNFGVDIPHLLQQSRFIPLDADETLALFMRSGVPDRNLFTRTFEPIFRQASATLRRPTLPVVAFGEMVSLLCEQDRYDAAFQVEDLWNAFAADHHIALRCAYPLRLFAAPRHEAFYHHVCGQHGSVIPAESFTRLEHREDKWRMVSNLQRQASSARSAWEQQRRSEQKRLAAESMLRESEEFARAIVDSTVDCVYVLDLEGGIQFVNAAGCQAMKLRDGSEISGLPWANFWPESEQHAVASALAQASAGRLGSFQAEGLLSANSERAWNVQITAARNSHGTIDRLIAICRDVTELRNAQRAAIHAEKLATAGRMAASIAHEINNPLEAVTNFIYLAQTHEGLPEEVREQLEIADRELTRVAHIARQTLGFYRSTSSESCVSLSHVVRDAIMIYERRMRNKDIQVDESVPEGLTIFAKDGELRQALLNLTANAIDACKPGGKIWFRARQAHNWKKGRSEGVRFTLADNGTGMAPEIRDSVFAPFFTTKGDIGTGIGLWVTKRLIEQRGGFLRFRTRQGEHCGTVMTFFLPSVQPAS